ncbi:MAG: hypothetical protein JWP89_1327 [Schlesneria sp.]|nr:hypothetical protein [Schlesneria sp.]
MTLRERIVVAVLLSLHFALLFWATVNDTVVVDEVGHLAAGISHWRTGNFDLYNVNPPLARLVGTIPAVCFGLDVDLSTIKGSPWKRHEFDLGADVINGDAVRALLAVRLGRCLCFMFSLIGAWGCFSWATELWGGKAGIAALALWCFSPTVLAYGHLFTPDVAGAAFGVVAYWRYWRFLNRPDWAEAIIAGIFAGLALASKSTWIVILPPSWLIMFCLSRHGKANPRALAVVAIAALQVLWASYGFERAGFSLGEFRFSSRAFGAGDYSGENYSNRYFGDSFLSPIVCPLPPSFVEGIDRQATEFERRSPSFLNGEWKFGGWWYYYICAFIYKEPVGLLAIMAWSLFDMAFSTKNYGWKSLYLLTPGLALVLLISSQTGINHHLRYLLPAYPFFFILAGRLVVRSQLAASIFAFLLALSMLSVMYRSPHFMSYFNEAAGGPNAGHSLLAHSNVDWGQGGFSLKSWLNRHPEARPIEVVQVHSYSMVTLTSCRGLGVSEVEQPSVFGSERVWVAIPSSCLYGEYAFEGAKAWHSIPCSEVIGGATYYIFGPDRSSLPSPAVNHVDTQ